MKQIITVHGIRTQETWGTILESLLKGRNDVKISHFEYGFLSVFRFIWGHIRGRIIEDFQDWYAKNYDAENPPSIVCHSFGSLIFFASIKSYKAIKFDKVILCGSILNSRIDWTPYFKTGQINALYNDYGLLDDIVKFSMVLEGDCGTSGKNGFSKIPKGYESKFFQAINYLKHGGYFYEPHMKAFWLPFLLPKPIKYDTKILRDDVIARIYDNWEKDSIGCSLAEYRARIDEHGNYFAHYAKTGVNTGELPIEGISISTSSDSFDAAEEMDFAAYDKDGNSLETSLRSENDQHKSFFIKFKSPVKPNEEFYCRYQFQWKKSISFNLGDFDHFKIRDAKNVNIVVNFKFPLQSPRLFSLRDQRIVEEIVVLKRDEVDGSKSYYLNYENKDNYDSIAFYFERSVYNRPAANGKELKNFKKIENDVKIYKCASADIPGVHRLEVAVEKNAPASESTLKERWEMFGDGFLVAKDKKNVVGYVQTILWQDFEFTTFDAIKNFPQRFDIHGDTLYVIFLAVKEDFRKKGIGGQLMELVEHIADKYKVRQIKLVTRGELKAYYESMNYIAVKELPDFLPGIAEDCFLMQKERND